MSILHPQNLIKMQWARYKSYDVSTLEEYLRLLSPDKSSEHIDQLHKSILESSPAFSEGNWIKALKSKIVHPTPNSKITVYDPFKNQDTIESCHSEFLNLWRNNNAPNESKIVSWAEKYGLPCRSLYSHGLSVTIELTARKPIPNSSTSYAFDLSLSRRLELLFARLYSEEESTINGTKNCMLLSLVSYFARELYWVRSAFKRILDSQDLLGLDRDMLLAIDAYIEDPLHPPQWLTSSQPTVSGIKEWNFLISLFQAHLRGLLLTFKEASRSKQATLSLEPAFKIEDLLTAMWLQSYWELLHKEPIGICKGCGNLFPRKPSSKRHCSVACKNLTAVNKFRAQQHK